MIRHFTLIADKVLFFLALTFLSVGIFIPTCSAWMPGIALFIGILIGITSGNPYKKFSQIAGKKGLNYAVIGLGFGMNVVMVLEVGKASILLSIIGITLAMLLGWGLGKVFKINRNLTLLMSAGTAICGGSAIAATAGVLDAENHEISISTAVVFLLNASALLIFPLIGEWAHMSQADFGQFAALAIHDTSSVVGATSQYGPEALAVGTAVKLARALWIIPLAFIIALIVFMTQKGEGCSFKKINIPWFILFFILASTLVTYVPAVAPVGKMIAIGAKEMMVFVLFFIGANIHREHLKQMGVKPLMLGLTLWVVMSVFWFVFL